VSDFLGLEGKTLLITGATSGIGKATCEEAVNCGARIIAIGRNTEQLAQLKVQYSNQVQILRLNLLEANYLDKIASAILKEEVHGFLHAAGISPTMPINREKRDTWDQAMRLNVYTGVEIAQLLVKTKRSCLSSIVYVSSVMADLAEKAKGTYSMSKAALNAVARNQALEYARFKVRVNTIAPGVVNTPLSQDSVYRKTEEGMNQVLAKHPLGLGEPDDVAKTALFLLSDAAGWITGSTLTIDGGYSIT